MINSNDNRQKRLKFLVCVAANRRAQTQNFNDFMAADDLVGGF